MKLATIRLAGRTSAVRVESDHVVETGEPDVGVLLARESWRAAAAAASGPTHSLADVEYAPVVPKPGKIICVGLNYRSHILEMGRELPEYPTLFAKFSEALVGAQDDIELPTLSTAMDWEAELAVVIGRTTRNADAATSADAIAGYSVLNDVTARDLQYRSTQWLQGKTLEGSTPFGPVLVTPDELDLSGGLQLAGYVDNECVQKANTSDLVFDPSALVAYISQIVTLRPGDVIATGTPGGVGHAREPKRYLSDGSRLRTTVEGIGELSNRCIRPANND